MQHVSATSGWEPLDRSPERKPPPRHDPFVITPFQRLARTHVFVAGADAVIAVALAGSLFFDIDPQAARWRVAAYLLFTLAPFAVLAPFLAPAVDRMRGGRRLVIVGITVARVVVTLLMAANLDSFLLFPLAFVTLVLQRTYSISRAALVPTVVRDPDALVEANAKLGLLSGLAGFGFALPALVLQLVSAEATMVFAALVFVVASVLALRLPRDVVAATPADELEKRELHAPSIMLAASAMGLLRAAVGFLTFQVAFWFRNTGTATIWFGIVVAASVLATMTGNLIGGRVRQALVEERMLVAGLSVATVAGVAGALVAGRGTAALVAAGVGLGAALGRLAFDAIVQRDAPDANRGRAFARFETRFQLAWVAAAVVPVVVPIPGWLGFLITGLLAGAGAVTYVVGSRRLHRGEPLPEPVVRAAWRRFREARRPLGPPEPGGPLPPPAGGPVPGVPLPPPGPVQERRHPFHRPHNP
jgi:MFS family permease